MNDGGGSRAGIDRFFEMSLELLAVAGTDGFFRTMNPAWERVLGWTEAELLAEPFVSFVHPDDVEPTLAEVGRLAEGLETVSFVNRYRHKDGTYRELQWTARADPSGEIYAAARDVSEHSEALAQAHDARELWESVLHTAVDPIVMIDEMGVIQRVNPATTEMFGYSVDELAGQNVKVLMPEPYRAEHDGYLHNYRTTGDAQIIGSGREVEAQRADGSVFPMALAVSEVETDSGRLFTGVIHDLTDRNAAERQMREANELLEQQVQKRTAALEASNRDLEQFAYIASHDLQAPLRNVRQGLELLDDHLETTVGQSFDDEAQELRGLVIGAVTRMEDLIHGLLSYSKVQRHAKPVTNTVDLEALVAEVVQQLHVDLEDAGATVVVDDLPTVTGDHAQLRQLLQNLIQNAIKYRVDQRAPQIRISAGDTDDHWVVSVRDNGVGIDEAQHHRIFDLFRRGHPGYDGVGLGLAICQRIVQRHRGDIWVESQPDQGATFTFTLAKMGLTEDD